MTMKINGVDNARPITGLTSAAPARASVTEPEAPQTERAKRDVEVSNSARTLADLESRVMRSSGVDLAKVEAVKLALERGDYQIDPQKIADQLIRLDFEIGKVSGRIK